MAITLAKYMNIDDNFITMAINSFSGASRRLEMIAAIKDRIYIYDDYGHHHNCRNNDSRICS